MNHERLCLDELHARDPTNGRQGRIEMPVITRYRLAKQISAEYSKHWGPQLTSVDRNQSAVCIICSHLKGVSVVTHAIMMHWTYAVQVGLRDLIHR